MHNLKKISKIILLLEHFIATRAVLATHNADVQIREIAAIRNVQVL